MTDSDQITQHLARYCFAADRGTPAEITDLFWDDATLDASRPFVGRAEILKANEAWVRKMRDPVVGLRYLIYTPHIVVTDERATAETYFDADGHSKKLKTAIGLRGVYSDILEKRDSVWKFARRKITIMLPRHKSLDS